MSEVLEPDVANITSDSDVFLYLGGEQFACRRLGTTWEVMRQTKISRLYDRLGDPDRYPKDDPRREETRNKRNELMGDLIVMQHDMVMKLLKPYERDRFMVFMETAELGLDELDTALGDLIVDISNRGKANGRSGSSSEPPANSSEKSLEGSSKPVMPRELELEPNYSGL